MSAIEGVALVRTFIRQAPGRISLDQSDSNTTAQIVCEAEAGQTLFASGAPYRMSIVVRDLTSSATPFSANQTGFLGDPNWDSPSVEFSFTLPPQGSGQKWHTYQTIASLIVEIADPIVDIIESPFFIIT